MLEGRNISMSYRRKKVLKDISLTINKGEIVGIAGPNGVGKSTLIRILSGITPPTGGVVNADGGRVNALIETPSFYNDMTGRQNLEYYLDRQLLDAEIAEAPFKIGEFIDMQVKKYSLGMKQKLAIWFTCLCESDYLLLDEPMNSLDVETVEEMEKMLESMKEDRGILVSSHDLRVLQLLCGRVLVIKDGCIVDEVKQDTINEVVRIRLLGEIPAAVSKYLDENGYQLDGNWIELVGDEETVSRVLGDIVLKGGKVCEVVKRSCHLEHEYKNIINKQ